ncbi:unnamed protein product [Clonostachys rosea]|uniref:Invertebrate defensins family profile domain-containing protein n=1 Tax=Bionectria ochroleuca TaxID=29856 RepID=A0ABY6TY41_BIOOC|nr:unnamed protein product [Clonostachys rosea]
MHFTNVLISIFAVASVTTATLSPRMQPIQALDIREYEDIHDEMLAARDEYIEKRDLFRRLGGQAFCKGDKKPYDCVEAVPGPSDWAQKWRKCGRKCGAKDKLGAKCNC